MTFVAISALRANFVYFTRYGDKGITCTNVTEEAR